MVEERTPETIAAAEYERVICQVKGVLSARLVTDSEGQIQEIHVLATPDRSPKQVVRDIETAVLVQLGIPLDHKKISVAQLEDGGGQLPDKIREGGGSYLAVCGGLRLVHLNFFSHGIQAEASVGLEIGGDGSIYEGRAVGVNLPGRGCQLVAQATLEATGKYLGENYTLVLEDLIPLEVAHSRAILVVIGLLGHFGRERLAGVAFLEESPDELQAAAKAVLRALAAAFAYIRHDCFGGGNMLK